MGSQRAHLTSRGLLKIHGEDARDFLQNLLSCDISEVSEDRSAFGALLTPQGKILWDFFVHFDAQTDGFLLDVSAEEIPALSKRMTMYKLRAKVVVEAAEDTLHVVAEWGEDLSQAHPADPRLPALGLRYVSAAPTEANAMEADYEAHRIQLGVPQSGADFKLGDVFPHDVDMDSLNGVAFSKGCFVGQEVVSRMKHRGTARKRLIQVQADTNLPAAGSDIVVGEKSVGTMGSSRGAQGLALLRLDRVQAALAAQSPIESDGVILTPVIPEWATFTWPSSD